MKIIRTMAILAASATAPAVGALFLTALALRILSQTPKHQQSKESTPIQYDPRNRWVESDGPVTPLKCD